MPPPAPYAPAPAPLGLFDVSPAQAVNNSAVAAQAMVRRIIPGLPGEVPA